ncbi:MAG: hypothetical protein B6D61_14630 [Bacteroidetes bacterium 4484_249]|nr:MAG: hypothetical protein B6D61_14630 [Bacteroidetes bacterium 4484_249]
MKKTYTLLFVIILITNIVKTQTISVEERIYGLSKFWEEATYNFAFFENIPDVNYDELYKDYLTKVINEEDDYQYYRILQKFCAELKDGHTNVYMPEYLREKEFYPPVRIRRIKDEIYIINVGKSYSDIIPRGSKILKVDGQEVLSYLNENVYPYISGAEHIVKSSGAKTMLVGLIGEDKTITIEKPNKEIQEILIKMDGNREKWYYPLSSNYPKSIVEYKALKNNIGYISLNTFAKEEVVEMFISKLDSLYQHDALIIDIRYNGGGNSKYAHQITKYLTDKPYFFGEQGSTRKHLATYKAWGAFANKEYAEALGFVPTESEYEEYYYNNAWEKEKIDTFGSTGQPIFFKLPNEGSCRICTRKCTYVDGRKFIGIGIIPDIELEPDIDYYLSDKDIVLEKAIEYLNKNK